VAGNEDGRSEAGLWEHALRGQPGGSAGGAAALAASGISRAGSVYPDTRIVLLAGVIHYIMPRVSLPVAVFACRYRLVERDISGHFLLHMSWRSRCRVFERVSLRFHQGVPANSVLLLPFVPTQSPSGRIYWTSRLSIRAVRLTPDISFGVRGPVLPSGEQRRDLPSVHQLRGLHSKAQETPSHTAGPKSSTQSAANGSKNVRMARRPRRAPQASSARACLGPTDLLEQLAPELGFWSADTRIVGHLPYLGRLASPLLASEPDRPTLGFEPGSMACLEREADGRWLLVWMLGPALLAPPPL
jgi:hypothetical protein